MKQVLGKVHLYYCLVVFAVLFLVFFPFFLVPIIFKNQFKWVGILNRLWAKLLFPMCFLPYSVECRANLDPKQQYIFCPNHFSYLDIPTMGLNPHNTIFVGKHDMERIPLFGFMYRSLHITVDRERLKSRYSTYIKSREAIEQGKSLTIFPEGGIVSKEIPRMARFKDGAFRLAIEKQIPVVPVTIATNWILLPDELTYLRRHRIEVIIHEPLQPQPTWTVPTLKEEVYRILDAELCHAVANHKQHDTRPANT